MSLIDPLLRALEWDVGDPGLVEIEPIVGPGRADYALLRRIGEPLLLLEAKKLSDTKAHHGQLASYVVGENLKRAVKIPYCTMTNGSRWEVFDVFKIRSAFSTRPSKHEHARKCGLKLIGLWQPALREIGLEGVVDLGGKVEGYRSGDARGAREADTVPRPVDGPAGRTLSEEGEPWTPLNSETMSPSKYVRPERELRFPDGSVVTAGSWRKVLVSAPPNGLFDAGLLDPQDMPFSLVGAQCCVSTDGRRPDGKPFRRPLLVGETGIQLEGDLTGKQIVRFAVALLERSGTVSSEVELKLAD